nr:DUF6766 family protein [Streptomyces sp. ATCC 21386]
MTGSVRRFLRDNGLGLTFLALFALALVGQAFAGHADFDNQLAAEDLQRISLGEYVTSSDFAVDVMQNWQSEFLTILHGDPLVLSAPARFPGVQAGRRRPRDDRRRGLNPGKRGFLDRRHRCL